MKRLTLGMALIGRPKLVILSNPLMGMDPNAKSKLTETIMKYTEDRALLMSTTMSEEAERIGDRVAISQDGRLLCIGTVNEILKQHGSGYSLEIQADMGFWAECYPDPFSVEYDFIDSHNQARNILERIQEKLEEKKVEIACDEMNSEYTQ